MTRLLLSTLRQVITRGTRFNAEADFSNPGWLFRFLSGVAQVFDAGQVSRPRAPPPVPTTSLYSRGDGIVA
jgi:hypothetical protein